MDTNNFRGFCLLILIIQSAVGQIQKSSLTFVIDNTYSMHDDIDEVKNGVNLVFDTVHNSNASQIENFILVTFEDPGTERRIVTKDKNEFKNTLANITLKRNKDCPEMAMAGIELALKVSLPGSFIYVLTDASAKDYGLLEKVQNLAMKKLTQIVFLLTGRCRSETDDNPRYQAYYKLADATNGQVFHMYKNNVGEILKYVAEMVTSRKTVVTKVKFPPGYDHNMTIPVDPDMRDVVIAGSGLEPKINLTAPDGTKPHAEPVVNIPRVVAVKIKDPKPGNYTAKVGSKSETSVVVTATTSIQFKHGFSTVEAFSINFTTTKPIPDQESHLLIQLITTEEESVLDTVVLTDLNENVISEIPLKLIDSKQKLYDTALFMPPNSSFKIKVKGYDNKSKSSFSRTSPTPIEPQKRLLVKYDHKAPTITIEGSQNINAEYNEPLTLLCKVNGFPKPDALWLDNVGSTLPSAYSTLEIPNDYINVLKIEKLKNNATYKCKAANTHGEVFEIVKVTAIKKNIFNVIEAPKEPPKDMSPKMEIIEGYYIKVKNKESIKLVCNVEAYPKPDITWKDEDGNNFPTEVLAVKLPYSYMAELKIEKVTMNKTYKCSATNKNGDISRNIKVETERTQYIDILEIPKDTKIVYKNSDKVYCKVDALPPATITWHGNGAVLRTNEYIEIADGGNTLTIKKMMPYLVGGYSCTATNGLESKRLGFTLSITGIVPSTSITGPPKVNAEYNKPLFLRCEVKGYPKPIILWTNEKTGEEIRSAPVPVASNYDYGEEMQLENVNKNATYKCTAKNDYGEHSATVKVVTIQKVHFDIIEAPTDTTIKYKEEGKIFCKVDAYPSVIITWKFTGNKIKNNHNYEISSDRSILKIRDMQLSLRGYYSCTVYQEKTRKRKIFHSYLGISGTEEPQIDKTKNTIKVKEGSSIDIECRIIKGTPPPTLTWEFQPNDSKLRKLEASSSKINFERVTTNVAGAYRCTASNNAGEDDEHVVYLTVEFKPTIEEAPKEVDSKEGNYTTLPCVTRGFPKPTVVWNLNGAIIAEGRDYKILSNKSLRFSSSLKNSGIFKCTATNEHGTASIETQVNYYKEIEFVVPEATTFHTFVGSNESLRCKADGYPTPTITWQFLSSEDKPTKHPKVLKTLNPNELVVHLTNTNQDGKYICSASNKKSKKILTFKIIVKEPAHILPNAASAKPTKAVKGDLVRIPCQAVGKPKPYVIWQKNGINLATGIGGLYNLDTDGALVIEGIEESSSFTCSASNDLSRTAYMYFKVDVKDPEPTKIHYTYLLKFGKPAEVKCHISHKRYDLMRWYKDSVLSVTGELKFDSVSYSDAGVYTCRVSHQDTLKSESSSVEIVVIP